MTATGPGHAQPDELASALSAAREGDDQAFRALYQAIQPGMLRYLQVLVGADAEDVASETWLHIVKDLHTFRGDSNGFRRWTITIARHRALDHLRHHQRRPSVATPVETLADLPDREVTEDQAMQLVSTSEAMALIASLPPDQAEAILLRVVIGLDAESSAKVLGKRAGAVRTAAYRGLRRLSEALGQHIPGTEE
ncbi:RNA polymerase sigma factor [Catelliglobosispora koreensis]|uniref:RNA polymerase sigma factor n=1 Tax=Catelliglobosispora koreensis TaxID=129052 RepID=UPI0003672113|nr:RNA polymerase sigma factor [Catelliglobosispora koreensis]